FEECQLLLNTTPVGPRDSLPRGIRLARRALDPYLRGGPDDWAATPLVRDLRRADRAALATEVAELILLEVRAHVAMATRGGTEGEPHRALRLGLVRLELVRWILSRPPAAFHRDRARLLAAIGQEVEAARERALAAANPRRTPQDDYLLGTAL